MDMKKIYAEPTTKPIELEPYSLIAESLGIYNEQAGTTQDPDDPDIKYDGDQW